MRPLKQQKYLEGSGHKKSLCRVHAAAWTRRDDAWDHGAHLVIGGRRQAGPANKEQTEQTQKKTRIANGVRSEF